LFPTRGINCILRYNIGIYFKEITVTDLFKSFAEELELRKSNYGPKNMGLYSESDNQKRKENNTGESLDNIGQNKNLKQYTTSNSSMQATSEKNTAKEQKKKTKASTRTMADFSPEELQSITDKANKPK